MTIYYTVVWMSTLTTRYSTFLINASFINQRSLKNLLDIYNYTKIKKQTNHASNKRRKQFKINQLEI